MWGKNYDAYQLRRIAGELENSLKQLDDVSETTIIGGQPRQVRVVLDTQTAGGLRTYAGRRSSQQLQNANTRGQAGSFALDNREFQVEAGTFFTRPDDLRQVVVGVHAGRPVYLRDVAEKIEDGPAEAEQLRAVCQCAREPGKRGESGISRGNHHAFQAQRCERHGHCRTRAEENRCASRLLAARDLNVTVTRNYGETAKDKSDELLEHLLIATLSVTLLIASGAGLARIGRCAAGHTGHAGADARRLLSVRLHAEPRHVVRADLLHRHPGRRRHCRGREHRAPFPPAGKPRASLADVAVEAVDEVGNPTILATFAVIARHPARWPLCAA